jgi:23S rRNA pseudouridine1911/1915/1917 synthase
MSGLRKNWKSGDKFLVRHKDDHIVVVEKSAGLLTVPTPNKKGDSLLGLLRAFVKHPRRRQTLFAVHRLDRVVSGLLVFSRTSQAKEHLITQFARHSVQRIYHACVEGVLPDDQGSFESWFQTDARTLRVYSSSDDEGKHALTHWRVLKRLPKHTLVEVRLETGARNQIRVHFSEAGFPLLGERKYLDLDHPDFSSRQGSSRIFLHATRLGFIHPKTMQPIEFDAALPPDLRKWQAKLTTGRHNKDKPRA